jgi:hypothetical protein
MLLEDQLYALSIVDREGVLTYESNPVGNQSRPIQDITVDVTLDKQNIEK